MSQGQHSEDTVWIVVEPDMCFYKIDAAARLELLQGRMPAHEFKEYEEFGQSIQDFTAKRKFFDHLEAWRNLQTTEGVEHVPWPRDPNAFPDPKAQPLPPWRKKESYTAPVVVQNLDKVEKVADGNTTVERVSTELVDMVLYFNAAARMGRDGLLWCGWNASQWSDTGKLSRSTSPAAGAHLVMVSTKGARFLMDKRNEIPDMHMGNFLSKKCGNEWQDALGAAYLCPPIGSYVEHISSTTPGQVLKDHFGAKWAQEGTRPMKDGDKPRYICAFTEKGPAAYLHENGLDFRKQVLRQSYYWLTEAPPHMPELLCGPQEWHEDNAEEHPSPPPWLFQKKEELAALPPQPARICMLTLLLYRESSQPPSISQEVWKYFSLASVSTVC